MMFVSAPPPYDDVCIDPIFDLSAENQAAIQLYEQQRLERLAACLGEDFDGLEEDDE